MRTRAVILALADRRGAERVPGGSLEVFAAVAAGPNEAAGPPCATVAA